MSDEVMVQLTRVTKRFGAISVLRGIDLTLRQGRYLGLFGPNGAGKTTLLKILATVSRPSSGKVCIAGYDAIQETHKIRPLLGILSHRTFLYGHLTAFENLHFYGRMLGIDQQLPERIGDVLRMDDLDPQRRQLVRTYSRCMQQRLAIARAILHRPSLLLLDEPHTGLDHHAVHRLHDLLERLHTAKCTVIMSTHDLQRGLELCDEIVIQSRGRIVYHGLAAAMTTHSVAELYATYTTS